MPWHGVPGADGCEGEGSGSGPETHMRRDMHLRMSEVSSPRFLPNPGRNRHVICGSSVLDRGSEHYCTVGNAVTYGVM